MPNPRLASLAAVVAVIAASCYAGPRERAAENPSVQFSSPSPRAPAEIQLVLLGDSLARGTGDESGTGFGAILAEELKSKNIVAKRVVNLGLDGARTNHLLAQLELDRVRRLVQEADLIVVSIGANDLFFDPGAGRGDAPTQVIERILGRLDEAVAEIRELNVHARVIVIGLYNPFFDTAFAWGAGSFVQRWNASLATRYAGRDGVTVVQTYDLLSKPDRLGLDRFHPSAEGYRHIARRIAESL